MEIDWGHVVVIGAAGKMGSGISLLLLQEMASMPESLLTLVETNQERFQMLSRYLREHLQKYAERNINQLRQYFKNRKDLVDNEEMIEIFVVEAFERVRFVTSLDECRGAHKVFEAIIEDVAMKAEMFSTLHKIVDSEALYFTNTSSIPIHILEKKCQLQGRLIGFHFYNPPSIQKLLEIIVPKGARPDCREIALGIGKKLNKILVFSKDIAGFIGNGHFIREVVEGCFRVENLKSRYPLNGAISLVNTITQDYLIRPMGLFQLIDYVGIDVVQRITKIMTEYLSEESFNIHLINRMVERGIKGGQHGDGSQKDGFFTYEKGKPVKVYDLETNTYVPYVLPEDLKIRAGNQVSWKSLIDDKEKEKKLSLYFSHLFQSHSDAEKIAIRFLERSKAIAHSLVKDGVARSVDDVDTVLKNGFFHLYGVDDPWKGECK